MNFLIIRRISILDLMKHTMRSPVPPAGKSILKIRLRDTSTNSVIFLPNVVPGL